MREHTRREHALFRCFLFQKRLAFNDLGENAAHNLGKAHGLGVVSLQVHPAKRNHYASSKRVTSARPPPPTKSLAPFDEHPYFGFSQNPIGSGKIRRY